MVSLALENKTKQKQKTNKNKNKLSFDEMIHVSLDQKFICYFLGCITSIIRRPAMSIPQVCVSESIYNQSIVLIKQ